MTNKVVAMRGRGRPSFSQVDTHAADRFVKACKHISVSKSHALPLWRQIAEPLEVVIRGQHLEPHSRIPSEEALSEMFGVSRPVIRNALKTLEAKSLVVKVHRKGIFVGAPPPETDFLTSNISLYDDMVRRGHKVRATTFEFFRSTPDEAEREALKLGLESSVIRIGRVFWMDDEAITYTRMSLNGDQLPGFEAIDIEDRSILGLVRERYGLQLKRAERWFKATSAPDYVSKAMNIELGMPMISIESVAYDSENSPLEFYRAYYNSDAARIHLSIVD